MATHPQPQAPAKTPARPSEAGPKPLPPSTAGDWFVLHTKPRQEKAVVETLAAMGIAHYLPLLRKPRYYGRRKVFSDLPLFAGYVFLRGSREQAFAIDRTDRLVQIITVPDQASLDAELANIHQALSLGAEVEMYPELVAGRHVEVRAGPFRGIRGVVDERRDANRLILQVQSLGRAVSLEIEAELLDPIDNA
jgi:transcriptional antiterminator RfaH